MLKLDRLFTTHGLCCQSSRSLFRRRRWGGGSDLCSSPPDGGFLERQMAGGIAADVLWRPVYPDVLRRGGYRCFRRYIHRRGAALRRPIQYADDAFTDNATGRRHKANSRLRFLMLGDLKKTQSLLRRTAG